MEPFDTEELAADAVAQQDLKKDPVTLNMVRALAEKMVALESEIEADEAAVLAKKMILNDISQKQLPEMFAAAGMPMGSLKLADGTIIEVIENLGCGIAPEKRDEAHKWLRDHGFGDIIKNEVTVTFGKGEDEDAKKLVWNITEMASQDALHFGGLVQEERVHPSTLKSFVKEQLKMGTPLPVDTFKIFTGEVAKLRRPKVKKT